MNIRKFRQLLLKNKKSLAFIPKSPLSSARSVPLRGRIAIVTDVGMECDGRGLPQRGFWPRRRTADRGREIVWSWSPDAAAKPVVMIRR
ncbi:MULTISPECIES: hypothetical protein [unclassified Bradyrhizobium]|uniref:hypothetical protein n=1 Tax=unclassified Bradyrhizobium TaxID=2631580 RepID=UPI002916C922|nr:MULTISPECIES: hypothetical protein [unclassified Bradyrhizobium]